MQKIQQKWDRTFKSVVVLCQLEVGPLAECIPEVFRPLAWDGRCLISRVKFPPLCLCLGLSARLCQRKFPSFHLEGSLEPWLFFQHSNWSQLLWRRICLASSMGWGGRDSPLSPGQLSWAKGWHPTLSTGLAKTITFFNPQPDCARPLWLHCTKNVVHVLFVF